MPFPRILPIVAALGLFLSPVMTGQSEPAGAVGPRINVPFFAIAGHDQPFSGVTLADLAVLDNGKAPQKIIGIRSRNELPLRLGILIDTSNSERGSNLYQAAVHAASDFSAQVLNDTEDKVFIEKFDVAPNATQFMSKEQLPTFRFDLTPVRRTALFDALRFACDERLNNPMQDSLRVIVLFSDGYDNQSHTTLKEAIASAQRAGAVIFSVSTEEYDTRLMLKSPTGYGVMGQFAAETGGLAFLHLDPGDLPRVFAAIRGQIDNMYLLSYVPADSGQSGQYRSLGLRPASKATLRLRAPKGYYVNQ